MSQTTDTTASSGSGSSAGQVQEKAREVAGQAQEQVREKTQQAKEQAGSRLRSEVDRRSTDLGQQVVSVSEALRQTGERLRSQDGQGQVAEAADKIAERADRLGGYLRDSDGDAILRDAEGLARRRPWLLAGGAALAGFALSRLLKASSSRRYESTYGRGRISGADGDSQSIGYSTARPAGELDVGRS